MGRLKRKLLRGKRVNPPAYLDYSVALKRIVQRYGAQLLEQVKARWPQWSAELAHVRATRQDAADVGATLNGVLLQFQLVTSGSVTQAIKTQVNKVNAKNRSASNANAGKLVGVQPFGANDKAGDSVVDMFVDQNLELIKNVTATQTQQIGQVVRDGLLAGDDLKATAALIQERTEVAASRARLIARDQTSKLNAALTASRMQQVGVRKYKWSTSNDERVRPSHASKEGKIFYFNDPPADTGNPGDDIDCRCVAIAVFEGE